jgi:hypothetical protein
MFLIGNRGSINIPDTSYWRLQFEVLEYAPYSIFFCNFMFGSLYRALKLHWFQMNSKVQHIVCDLFNHQSMEF